jgi:hypothetical protein
MRYGGLRERSGRAGREKQVWAWAWAVSLGRVWGWAGLARGRGRAERERWLAVPGAWSGGGLRALGDAGQVQWGIGGTDGLGCLLSLSHLSPFHGSAVLVLLGLVERAELESGVDVDVRMGFSA